MTTGYEIALSVLRKNRRATYADVTARARRAGVKVWPINFGRAQKALNLVGKGSKRRTLKLDPATGKVVTRRRPTAGEGLIELAGLLERTARTLRALG